MKPTSPRVRPWREGDRGVVVLALGPPASLVEAQGRRDLGLSIPSGFAATVVAEAGDSLVGVASLASSRWHPQRLWAYVEVVEEHRGSGHGSRLLEVLREQATADGRPLRTKVSLKSAGAAFADARGFVSIQRCRTWLLRSETAVLPPARGLHLDLSPGGEELATAFHAFYARTHEWDPVGEITPSDVAASHIEDASARFLVRRDGAAIAVGGLYPEGNALLLSAGPTSASKDGQRAVDLIVAAAVRHAVDARATLTVEVDDANRSLATAIGHHDPVVIDETHIVSDG